jgi:formylmethanofuran dehydrogenase subunit E
MNLAVKSPRKLERQIRTSLAIVFILEPDCKVCGKRMNQRFLRKWNDRDVCVPCITELTAEVPDAYST